MLKNWLKSDVTIPATNDTKKPKKQSNVVSNLLVYAFENIGITNLFVRITLIKKQNGNMKIIAEKIAFVILEKIRSFPISSRTVSTLFVLKSSA